MDEFSDRPAPTYVVKYILKNINKLLFSISSPISQMSILSTFHKFRPDYPFSKNLLILSNKILKYVNGFHVFRKQWIIGILSIGLGLGFSYADDKFNQIIALQRQRQMIINGLLTKHVLQNKTVEKLLIKVLSKHVFPNSSIHYQFREVILHSGIQPQMPMIKKLVKQISLNALREQQNVKQICKAVKPVIKQLQKPIVDFLKSQLFQKIVTDGIKTAVQQEAVQDIIRDQIVQTVRDKLKNQEHMEGVYKLIKTKIL